MSGTMNNTLQSPKTRVSTSCYHVARVKESNPVMSHVSSKTQLFQRSDRRKHCKPSSQMNHVEDLFPEFFNRKSDNTLACSVIADSCVKVLQKLAKIKNKRRHKRRKFVCKTTAHLTIHLP